MTSPEASAGEGYGWRQRLPAGTRNLLLTIEYDGAPFAGWQAQPGHRTVQGALADALKILCRHDVIVRGAGRTDAGVHAWAQRANVYTHSDVPVAKFVRGTTGILRGDASVVAAEQVPIDFDARRDALGKVYAYRLLLRSSRSPLREGRAWHIKQALDFDVLSRELATLPAKADWSAFRSADCGSPHPTKTLQRAWVELEPNGVAVLRFQGSGFLKQMVRILVGTAVDVALGRRPEGAMLQIRNGRDRTKAGPTAPAHGLYLEEVLYPR